MKWGSVPFDQRSQMKSALKPKYGFPAAPANKLLHIAAILKKTEQNKINYCRVVKCAYKKQGDIL